MQKIVFGVCFSLIAVSLMANQVHKKNWDEGTTMADAGSIILFNYDRSNYSIEDQNRYQMKKEIENNICSKANLRKMILSGVTSIFNYTYKDGTITIFLDSCD